MSGIGEVEALIAQRKVGDLVAGQCQCQRGPVAKRWINDFVAANRAPLIGDYDVCDLAAPSFREGNHEFVWSQLSTWNSDLTAWELSELIEHELQRASYFQPAHECPRMHVARPCGRHRNVRETEDAVRVIVPDIAATSQARATGPTKPSSKHFSLGTAPTPSSRLWTEAF